MTMKLNSIFTSAGEKYWENGAYYYRSGGTVEARSDGKYFLHYTANMGDVYHEISSEEYKKHLRNILAKEGAMKVTQSWRELF